MWKDLPRSEKKEYKRMILAFSSLTEMFAQKKDDDIPSPIINSKYQETVFQRVFHASGEDVGNTSYDVSLRANGKKYLVGIKTFGINSGEQKVAQFKADSKAWSNIINKIQANAIDANGVQKTKNEIDAQNRDNYMRLAKEISLLRNERIKSSKARLRGFKLQSSEQNVESVYHTLMPSKKGDNPLIYVGEIPYDTIDVNNIRILGCSTAKNPANFSFTDGNHSYRYTSADSQLWMCFENNRITQEAWEVIFAEDAYEIFSKISDQINAEQKQNNIISESYSWLLNVEPYSGLNNFYGVGSKLGKDARKRFIKKLNALVKQNSSKEKESLVEKVETFLTKASNTTEEKNAKDRLRKEIIQTLRKKEFNSLKKIILKKLFRPINEVYIPLPDSKKFHKEHPNFFGPGFAEFKEDGKTLKKNPESRTFKMIFEPSGKEIEMFITQDNGKGLESKDKQSYLGEWLLREVFQLRDYEPLNHKKLESLGINGFRLYKTKNSNAIHFQFLEINVDKLPKDFVQTSKEKSN